MGIVKKLCVGCLICTFALIFGLGFSIIWYFLLEKGFPL